MCRHGVKMCRENEIIIFVIALTMVAFAVSLRPITFSSLSAGQKLNCKAAPSWRVRLRNIASTTMSVSNASTAPASFQTLSSLLKEVDNISSVMGVLGWDEQVMMPGGAAALRGAQKAAMTAIIHERRTSDELKNAIAAAEKDVELLNPYQHATVRDAARDFQRKVRVTADLEREIAAHEVIAGQKWVQARKNDDFELFAPFLEKSIDLIRRKVQLQSPDMDPYNAMIDTFERGMTATRLQEIFDEIRQPLKDLLTRTMKAKRTCKQEIHPDLRPSDKWTVEGQRNLCSDLCNALGFDLTKGRIDVSTHPFTGGAGPSDVRITTRYSTQLPFEGITGTIHEVGHGLYEQGRNNQYAGLPVSESLSMGAHESQSLFWERMIGLNENFWESTLSTLHQHLPHTKDVTPYDMFFATNQVEPGLNRVNADELTYPFHIMLRFDLEQRLVSGSLDVKDIPSAWRAGMKDLLGVEVPNDAEGALQDIHWSFGAFGYFPSYSLGAMTAAQLFHYLKSQAMPDIEDKIKSGEFSLIRDWLRNEIHEVGSLYPSLDELLVQVTGEPLVPKYFIEYLDKKYAKVYGDCQ